MKKLKTNLIKAIYKDFKIKFNFFDIGAALPLNNFIIKYIDFYCLHLFEPQHTEFKKIKKKYKNLNNINFYNVAISNKPTVTLNLYNSSNLSSKFKFDERYSRLIKKSYIKKKLSFKSQKLSKYISIISHNTTNTLKVDIQGMGLDCLKSLKKKIDYISVIIIESDIISLYKNQDCGFEIDKFLYEKNYLNLGSLREFKKSIYNKNRKYKSFREITYSNDLLYVKNFFKLYLKDEELINIIFYLLNFSYYDLSEYVIKEKLNNNFYKKKLLKLLNNLKKLSKNKK
ncbi:FkbM family methyltransferase [Candidatus Pelagibacter sp.]|nr:FkbM family methyltransferase [Candidatus Pelagibacter sp.]